MGEVVFGDAASGDDVALDDTAIGDDVVLGDESTSRLHARIRIEGGSAWIHDEGSSGGTWVIFQTPAG